MKFIKKNKDVSFFAKRNEIVTLSNKDFKYLKTLSLSSIRKRSRICCHSNNRDTIHEMFIFHPKKTYVRPHKNIFAEESFYLISGKIILLIFDNFGKITKTFLMSDFKSKESFYYRIAINTFHTQIFLEDTIFFETTKGPFKKESNIFADWAPDEKNSSSVKTYQNKIKKYCLGNI